MILCIDISESMGYGKPTKLNQAINIALKAVNGLDAEDHVSLVAVDSEPEVIMGLELVNSERVETELKALSVRGVSCVAAGLMEAVRILQKECSRAEILMLTDGRANLSLDRSGGFEGSLDLERELLDISNEIGRKKNVIHTVSIGEDAFTYTLSMMARNTGGIHWIAESFQGLDSTPKELDLRAKILDLRVHGAPVELPSARPTWTKESQFIHLTVVSQRLYETYEPSYMAFLTNPVANREARTALISIEDESLTSYRERRPKTVKEIREESGILLDKSYRDYLALSENGLVNLLIS